MSLIKDIRNIKKDTKSVKDFGRSLSALLLIFYAAGVFVDAEPKAKLSFLCLSLFFALATAFFQRLIYPVYLIWMPIGVTMVFVLTRIVLFVLFFVVLTPIALLLRLFKPDILDKKRLDIQPSFWAKISKDEHKSYETQY